MEATYSAEDNKLRLYSDDRLDDETYQRVRKAGFRWAPKQELFVAPMWTPFREDLCIELAGTITAETTTLVERAETKAERLDALAAKRSGESNSYHRAADLIAQRFAGGQPILIGHHSERKARRDQDKMRSAMDKAIKAQESVQYWNWKAEGVEHHANRKASPGVRVRRIKTLLVELRDRQRDINHAGLCLALWENIEAGKDADDFEKRVHHFAGAHLRTGSVAPYYRSDSLLMQLEKRAITSGDAVQKCLVFHAYQANSPHTLRWINHVLNRLAYERSQLGGVARFAGELNTSILQAFARTHGADRPKATPTEAGFSLVSFVPLPLHIANGKALALSADEWRDLMVATGYEVPPAKPRAAPILNFKAGYIKGHSWGKVDTFRQITLTKAEYKAIYEGCRGVKLSECGRFRFKFCQNPAQRGYDADWCAVFLTDSKAHPAVDSPSVIADKETA